MLHHPPSWIRNDTQSSSYIRPFPLRIPTILLPTILWETFRQYVAPVVNRFHFPSTKQTFMDTAMAPDLVDHGTKPLMFSIYYAAVASMTDDTSIQNMENARSALLVHYQYATQQALIKADIFHTQSIRVLQAAVLLWTCMQNQDDSGSICSMVSMLFRMAQTMGMHLDGGTMLDLTPVEVEVRRRVWGLVADLLSRSAIV
ncbi:hypothetical protein N7471_000287 [Penicillium samsonianum]|uniref:uncharacterized protein n=1 Tax=Penicillium samsonianum TaxID=1882272 RepID=UPI002548C4AA|nr:uncharacterized protein N7471_000287 [Penicillium samsonianum]KAJ6149088.1 hypothetical protein N7471_000287 [Penicillium samsonianum]